MAKQLGCILALALLTSCASDASVAASPERPVARVALLLDAFANADPTGFAPEPLDVAEVDLQQAHEQISGRIGRATRYRSPVRVLSEAETAEARQRSTVSLAEGRARMSGVLEVLDAVANEQPPEADRLRGLRSPVAFPGWNRSDRILLVVALETRLRNPRLPSGRGRSVVGCFWFDGAGESLFFVPASYDFRTRDTQELVRVVAENCRLPQS